MSAQPRLPLRASLWKAVLRDPIEFHAFLDEDGQEEAGDHWLLNYERLVGEANGPEAHKDTLCARARRAWSDEQDRLGWMSS